MMGLDVVELVENEPKLLNCEGGHIRRCRRKSRVAHEGALVRLLLRDHGRRSNVTIRALSCGAALRRAAVHAALWRSVASWECVHHSASANAGDGGANPSNDSMFERQDHRGGVPAIKVGIQGHVRGRYRRLGFVPWADPEPHRRFLSMPPVASPLDLAPQRRSQVH